MDTRKVLVIGVDAATFDLIDPWVAQGVLPNFQRLMAEGTRATLWSAPNSSSAAAWTSFATGKNPGKHGIYYFTRPKKDSYEMQIINGSHRDGLTVWQIASHYGKKVGVVNVPMTYPADSVNGFMISGMDAPGSHVPGWTYPDDLMDQIPSELGEYAIECGLPTYAKAGRLDKGLELAYQTIEQRTRYSLYLTQNFPWDLFITVYRTIDPIQHYSWKHMSVSEGSASDDEGFSNAIRDGYIRVDQGIGQLMQQAPSGTRVIIVSDHGGGASLLGFKELPGWLVEHGFMALQLTKGGKAVANSLLRRGYQWADAYFAPKLKKSLSRLLPAVRDKVVSSVMFGQVDWSRTRLYITAAGRELRVNLKGREAQGIVEPGEEYETLCDEVIAALLEWRDLASGDRLITDVKRREEVYAGPHVAEAADLLIYWNYENEALHQFASPSSRSKHLDYSSWRELISGGHRPNGVFIAHGPGIQPGRDAVEADLWDVAPTILYILGLPIPKDMDGKLLRQIFVRQLLEQYPPEYVDLEGIDLPRLETRPSGEDEELLKERLRGLGYIE